MFLSYLKLASRLLFRNPFLTFIHIAGLSVGLATFMMLWPLAEFELKSDKYHTDSERIVRLGVDYKWTDDNQKSWEGFLGAFNWVSVLHEIERKFSHVESTTWVVPQFLFDEKVIGVNGNLFINVLQGSNKKTSFRVADAILGAPNLFQFFTIPLIAGDAGELLTNPNSVVLSETMAGKYFGETPGLGQTIYMNDTIPLKVTGIFKDLPHNTHLKFSMVLSAASYEDIDIKAFYRWYCYAYLKLKAGETIESFDSDLKAQQATIFDFAKQACSHCDISSYLQPLQDVVFSNLRENVFNYKSKFLLEALGLVAFVVLAFAWINYITLSVIALNKRLTEIGTRKSVGANMKDFFAQFFVESMVINLVSFGIAITLIQLIGKIAESLFGFYIPSWEEISLKTTFIILFTLGLGVIIATLCPIMMIDRRKPTELLKKVRSHIGSGNASTVLVTTQYCVATILLVWIGAVYFQLNFLLNKDIGVTRDGVIVVDGPLSMTDANRARIPSFLKDVRRLPDVTNATASNSTIAESDLSGNLDLHLRGSDIWFGSDSNGGVDEEFLDTYDIPLLAGRNFQADNPADEKNILISKALTKRLGFAKVEDAIGKIVVLQDSETKAANNEVQIIGVFRDYEFRPFFSDITEKDRGVALTYRDFAVPEFTPQRFSIKIDLKDIASTLMSIEQLYSSAFQESLNWTFLDEKIRLQYADDQATKNQLAFFSILAVGITCLGLLGMISNKVVEKTKEIGIRKVLGARLHQIAQLLITTTVRQVVIANVVGIPLAYYLVQQYLEKFSERLSLAWWHYAIPACILMAIMLMTVASVLMKATKSNPVEALKHE